MSFPENFLWGASSAAFQIEGGWDADGKAPSIWDAMVNGHIKDGTNGSVACDHYHRFREDVQFMREISLKSYRFSVSWPRVIPSPGVVNPIGLAFYNNLVDELVHVGIEPIVTLYHWDLPMWAHNYGGWENERIADDFAAYTKIVVEALSDRVSYWLTFNEPTCFVAGGYQIGMHAPFRTVPDQIPAISRNVLLAHGRAVQAIRTYAKTPAKISIALSGGGAYPCIGDNGNIQEAKSACYNGESIMSYSWWGDPIFLGRIPQGMREVLSGADLAVIYQRLDFLGFNIYNADSPCGLPLEEVHRLYPGMPQNSLHWPITPKSMYYISKWHYERYHLPLMVCENGFPGLDWKSVDGKIHDPQRIDYVTRYLLELERAINEGVEVLGYHYWALMDNMEWVEGYDPRFGLIYVDYHTQERTLKDSAYFYREVIQSNGSILHKIQTPCPLGVFAD